MENIKQLQDELINALTKVYHDFMATLEKFDEEQINEIPFEGSWTPGQVADHIIKATGGIPDRDTISAERPFNEKVGKMESVFLDFETKFKSPEFVIPGNGPFKKTELTRMFRTLLEKHKHKINNTDLKALCRGFELPTIGQMTRYEWFRFIIAHTTRHLYQLENIYNVMATPKIS